MRKRTTVKPSYVDITLLEEKVYRRLVSVCEEKRLLREFVISAIPSRGLMSEWDLALAYSKNASLLSEAQSSRARLIVENVFQGVAKAMVWAGQKVGSGVKAIVKSGGEALDVAGKMMMQLLEKIPGGEAAFEFLKEFAGEQIDKVKGYVVDAAKEFGEFITSKKNEILGTIFDVGRTDQGILAKLKELLEKGKEDFGDQVDKVKEWFTNFKEDPLKAARGFMETLNLRKILATIVSDVVSMILKSKTEVVLKIKDVLDGAGLTKSHLGVFFMRVLTFFSTDMSGEDTLTAAGNMWSAYKGIQADEVRGVKGKTIVNLLREILPKIVKGLISGESALEGIIRSAMQDYTALTKLFANAVKLIRKALSNLIKQGIENLLKSTGADPNSTVGEMVINAIQGLVGEES